MQTKHRSTWNTIGQQIRALREGIGIAQRELARRSGVTSPYLSDVENDHRIPSDATLTKIAAILGVPVATLTRTAARQRIAKLETKIAAIREIAR